MSELDRRELLMQAMEEAENEPETEEVVAEPVAEESSKAEISDADHEEPSEASDAIEYADKDEAQEAAEEAKPVTRPSTWKKEYVQIWDKMEKANRLVKKILLSLLNTLTSVSLNTKKA